MYWHLYLWTHLRVRYLVGSCVRWFIGTLPDRPIGLYRLKHEVALQRGLAYLSRCNSGWFCHIGLVTSQKWHFPPDMDSMNIWLYLLVLPMHQHI
jgi:hypothetical protein